MGCASRRKSLMLAIVSTPAKPPPATTKVNSGGRSARAHSVSASSRCAIRRLRNWIASPSDFIVSARSATPGRLKKFVTEPSARTRWSYSSVCECRWKPCETTTCLLSMSILSTSPQKKFTRRIIFRTGLTMLVKSRSLAAISCNIGVKRKKFSRLTTVTSKRGSLRFSNSNAA